MNHTRSTFQHIATALLLCFCTAGTSFAQVSIGVSLPGVSIGINLPAYPQFVRVPNVPVYYAPGLQTNYFFYDGQYWVFQQDNWYSSSWYDGPWYAVAPHAVPLYVLRIPVRYYRNPPPYFRNWQSAQPPRWGEHWGNDWSRQRRGWDQWDRRAAPAPAPLPSYQRRYSGERYPQPEQQRELQVRNYRYQSRDADVRRHLPEQDLPRAQVRNQPRQGPPRFEQAEAAAPRQPPGRGPDNGQGNGKGRGQGKGQDKDRDDGGDAGKERKRN